MNRLLSRILAAFAIGAALFAGLNALTLAEQAGSFLVQRSFLTPLAASALFAWAAARWKVPAQFRFVALCLGGIAAELFLTTAAWLGLLPGIATKEKCAYARVYWRTEGHGNSVRNRDGWHAPAFDTQASHRIALIGDSFVEAVEVHRSDTFGALLQRHAHDAGKSRSILPLGTHGTSPAYHLEVIDYAARHFQPQEIILALYLGNDLSDMTPETSGLEPGRFIFYDFDATRQLTLHPASAPTRQGFVRGLEFSHLPLLHQAPAILRSHSMIVQTANSIRSRLALRRELTTRTARADGTTHEAAQLGLNPAPFAEPETPLARRCLDLLLAELDLCATACARHGATMRLVTIPAFPAEFYRTQHGAEWTSKIGGHDYLRPEREIAAFAARRGWPCLALGAQMQADRLTPDTIRSFYFFEGTGHFTERGHSYCADAIHRAFFSE